MRILPRTEITFQNIARLQRIARAAMEKPISTILTPEQREAIEKAQVQVRAKR